MKKTITINLNNIVFTIDDDAYELLDNYLSDIRKHFTAGEALEIMNDIEARIAELFNERLQRNKNVINLVDVQDVISIMGNPSDFDDSEPDDEESKKTETTNDKKRNTRKFYRDGENVMIGGVASGLAAYFNMDVTLMRVLFVIGFIIFAGLGGGWFILAVYVVVWAVAPKAVTASQRLEMQGEDVTVENIKNEFENIKNYVESDKFKQSTKSIAEKLATVFLTFFKIIAGIVTGALVLACFVIVTVVFASLIILIFNPEFVRNFMPFSALEWSADLSYGEGILFLLAILIVIVCPILILIYGTVRLASGKKKNKSKHFLWIVGLIWFVGLVLLAVSSHYAWKKGMWRGIEWDEQWNSGEKFSESRLCAPFHGIDVSGNIRLSIAQDSVQSVTVRADANDLPDIITEVRSNVLYVSTKSKPNKKYRPVEVVLSTDSIINIHGRGASSIQTRSEMHSYSFHIELAGASNANLDLDITNDVKVKNIGASNMHLQGKSNSFEAEISGAGHLDARNFISKDVTVSALGASHAKVYATEKINAKALGASHVKCYGNPNAVEKTSAGISFVDVED